MPRKYIGQLPLAVLALRGGTCGTDAAVDDAGVALPVAIGRVVVGVSIGCAGARFEEGGSGAVGDVLLWVVAYGARTLFGAGVAVVEKCWGRRVSVCGYRKRTRG